MARRDIYHDTVKCALEKDGWKITDATNIDRRLYLAISKDAFNSIFTIELGQILLRNQVLRLIVFDPEREEILQWIPQ